jgi:hypothetical protein
MISEFRHQSPRLAKAFTVATNCFSHTHFGKGDEDEGSKVNLSRSELPVNLMALENKIWYVSPSDSF